jgi:hypothetical protein
MANNSSSSSGMRQYDMLTQCRVRIAASTVVDAPPVRPLPADIVALANAPPEPKPYDFAVGTITTSASFYSSFVASAAAELHGVP